MKKNHVKFGFELLNIQEAFPFLQVLLTIQQTIYLQQTTSVIRYLYQKGG